MAKGVCEVHRDNPRDKLKGSNKEEVGQMI